MTSSVILSLLLSCLLVKSTIAADYPFRDPSLSFEERVDDLVGRLTLEEITEQTLSVFRNYTEGIPRLDINPYVWMAECSRGLVNTTGTAFPHSLAMASSFSKDMLFKTAEAMSLEARAFWHDNVKNDIYEEVNGLSCFNPIVNIMRHPLWGRNQETYGEDPFLTGTLAQSYIRGLQGDDPRYVRVNAGCKHFDAHGGPESLPVDRLKYDADITIRDWRMTFLPQFKMCVEAGSYSLMCSYNKVRGVPACVNKELLTDIARIEWGFDGYVVSDAHATKYLITKHEYFDNPVDTVAACIKAGCNLDLGLPAFVYESQIEAIHQGKLTEQEVRDNVKPLMHTRMRLGEFDPPEMVPFTNISMSVIQSEAHRELAIKASVMSFVLLKNLNGALPIVDKIPTLAVVGPMANNMKELTGNFAPILVPQFVKTPYTGLMQMANVTRLATGCDEGLCQHYNESDVMDAMDGADVIAVCLGTGNQVEKEFIDSPSLDLPGQQLQLLQDVVYHKKGGQKVILLLFNGNPLDLTWAKLTPEVDAIMTCYALVPSTGEALYRSLTAADAQSVPAARLPATWPANLEQIPTIANYTMAGRTYRYYMGTPMYPFGYGLSYSVFDYSNLILSSDCIHPGESVIVTVDVINHGPYAADEVVQVYIQWVDHAEVAPQVQLVAFERVSLKLGEKQSVTMELTDERMALWANDEDGFQVLPGDMVVWAGGQQPNQREHVPSNVLKTEFVIRRNGHDCNSPDGSHADWRPEGIQEDSRSRGKSMEDKKNTRQEGNLENQKTRGKSVEYETNSRQNENQEDPNSDEKSTIFQRVKGIWEFLQIKRNVHE